MSNSKRKTLYSDREDLTSRYMTSTKKKYYLASVDQNIQLLTKEQANDLSTLLISLKSEYDSIVREKTTTEQKTEELCKKMVLLDRMDKKAKDKTSEANSNKEMIKEAIDVKKEQLTEETYTKKTLGSTILQLKKDIFLSRKTLGNKEEHLKALRTRYQKEKLLQNEIRERKNSVFNRITHQKKKNIFEKNEYDLQLHFYKTMIDQKWTFIQSADERIERQRKIAQEAKNDTQDKQEILKRRLFCLLHIMDKYLKCKMEEVLAESSDLEESFQKIKDICGTSNLQVMVDKIITKDKRYNLNVSKVIEQEQSFKDLTEEISLLKSEFDELKGHSKRCRYNSIVIIDERTSGTKDIQTIPSSEVNQSDVSMIKRETGLNDRYLNNQETYRTILLIYDQVVSNIKKLAQIGHSSQSMDNSGINLTNNNDSSFNNSQQLQNQDDFLVNAYNDLLLSMEKNIDMLFLCHTRQDFLKMMKEKGLELVGMKTNSLFTKGKQPLSLKSQLKGKDKLDEYDYQNEDENLNVMEKNIQQVIFSSYLNEIKTSRYNFVNNVAPDQDKKK